MSKRRKRGIVTEDILGDLANNEVSTGDFASTSSGGTSDIADFGYNSAVGHGDPFSEKTNREKIVYKSINLIYPNQMQPRRTLPTGVRQYFSSPDSDAMEYFFGMWLKEINLERKIDFPLRTYLEGKETQRIAGVEKIDEEIEQVGSVPKMGTLETAFMQVVELAASIMRDGLTNPISIARSGSSRYEIETGERRWLAYHLMNWQYPNAGWDKIPSRQVEDGISIWRQANENNVRADLNAIATARQFALLLMDILGANNFNLFDDFDDEQDFYAQVADGRIYSIPTNHGEKVINAMGISDVGQLRHIRRLLRLPNPVWVVADDLNWSESFIQKTLLRNAQSDEEIIRRALLQAKVDDYLTVSVLTPYQHLLQQPKGNSKPKSDTFSFQQFKKTFNSKFEDRLLKFKGKEREKTIEYLSELIEKLETVD